MFPLHTVYTRLPDRLLFDQVDTLYTTRHLHCYSTLDHTEHIRSQL